MPHFSFEYSASLEGATDLDALCRLIKAAMMESGLFELGAIRVRGVRCDHYAIADELAQNTFLDASLRIGQGRSAADKKRLGEALFAVLCKHFEPQFKSPYFALTLEIREVDAGLSWKKNAIHPRLRQS
jgi:5-carboxymethyl-2-hydroxymuconate isomerase